MDVHRAITAPRLTCAARTNWRQVWGLTRLNGGARRGLGGGLIIGTSALLRAATWFYYFLRGRASVIVPLLLLFAARKFFAGFGS